MQSFCTAQVAEFERGQRSHTHQSLTVILTIHFKEKRPLQDLVNCMCMLVRMLYVLYRHVCFSVRIYAHHMHVDVHRGQKRVLDPPGTGVTGGCEHPGKGSGNRAQVLCRSSKHS